MVRWPYRPRTLLLADEVRVSEGDLIGKTSSELRHLHFARDREYLQRDD
jgi:hypothetical protein